MLAGIREILVITTPHERQQFERLLGSGEKWGLNISFATQEQPNGLAEALLIGEEFIGSDSVALILGDNIFHGSGLGVTLSRFKEIKGATIFAHKVSNPSAYGVVEFDEFGRAVSLEEKPDKPKSRYVVPGLYFYDSTAVQMAKTLKPSARGELEITDLNRLYLENGTLSVERLERGTAWLDTGDIESLLEAAEFVRVLERRQGTKISVPEEIAWRLGLISDEQLRVQASHLLKSGYGAYLNQLLEDISN